MKKILVIGVLVLAGLWLAKRTHVGSYATTAWNHLRQEADSQVPVKFELDRIRGEIDRMDGDIRGMVSPIAEHMASISKLKKDIDRTRTRLTDQKANLLTMTTSLQKDDGVRGADQLRHRLQRDFNSYKQLQNTLATREKLLAAKEKSLDAAREKLNKLIALRDDFKVRLAQLEAEEENLQVARSGSDLQVDQSRATEIKAALDAVEHRQEVLRNEINLLAGELTGPNAPSPATTVNLDEIRNYLQGNGDAETRTVSQK
jgi:chromosome segregation ATPase